MSTQEIVRCPSCAQSYRVSPAAVGHHATCKKCRTRFRIGTGPQIDDDTVFAWISEEDPAPAGGGGPAAMRAMREGVPAVIPPVQKAARASASRYEVRLARMDTEGAHFEFPVEALIDAGLRNSFPRKCAGCGARNELHAHLIYWRERMPVADALTWQARQDTPVGRLISFERPFDAGLLKQLPSARGLPMPFCLPFPVFSCAHCRPSREVRGQVVTSGEQEICHLTIVSLSVAVDFFRDNGGRNSPDYHRLIEERDQRPDAWRFLDARVRQRVSNWFVPGPDERFVHFFHDAEFSAREAGASGMVLTSRRLVFHKYAACRDYDLDEPGRVEIFRQGAQSAVHIFDQSGRPAILKLDPAEADHLAGQLRQLQCRWSVTSRI